MVGRFGHYEIENHAGDGDIGQPSIARVLATIALVASLALAAAAQDRLYLSEQNYIIERARQIALQYTASLPNFISTETIRRAWLPKGFTDVEIGRHTHGRCRFFRQRRTLQPAHHQWKAH